MQFSNLLLRADKINTYILVEVSGRFTKKEALLILNFVLHSFSHDSCWTRV